MNTGNNKKTNIVISAGLNIIRKACMIAFPLISYSYATRVLGRSGIGIYEFALSIVNYFALLAALGTVNYAVRDGAKLLKSHVDVKDPKRSELDDFVSEVFSINLLMTIISYIILFVVVEFVPVIKGYKAAILIASISILFTTFAVDYINSLFEDYLYLTVRYIVVQIIAITALVVLVKSSDDLYLYIAISIFATVVNGILNYIYVHRYVKIRFTFNLNLSKHALPVFILFCNNIASVIYLNSDVTILRIMTDEETVGLYGVASKIYMMIKELMNAAIFVTIPRFSMYVSDKDSDAYDRYREGLKNLLLPLLAIVTPACAGLFCLSKDIIYIVSGEAFLGASVALDILAVAMFFAVTACFLAFAIIMPYKLEKYFLVSTSLAAVVNMILNIVLIPYLGMPAVAITTLIAEIMVFIMLFVIASGKVKIINLIKGRDIMAIMAGSLAIVLVCVLMNSFAAPVFGESGPLRILGTLITVVISLIVYMLVLCLFKSSLLTLVRGFIKKNEG